MEQIIIELIRQGRADGLTPKQTATRLSERLDMNILIAEKMVLAYIAGEAITQTLKEKAYKM